MPLCVATVVQNEAAWLPEWLEYHLLPHIGVSEFLMYDDESTDDTRGVLDRWARAGAPVRQFSTALFARPYASTTLNEMAMCARPPLRNRSAGNPPYSHWCEYEEYFPQQMEMVRHAARVAAAACAWFAFVDVDEFVIHRGAAPLHRWLSSLEEDVGGVTLVQKTMMTEQHAAPGLLLETEQLVEPEFAQLYKCIVRRTAMHPRSVGSIHAIILRNGQRYVRDAALELAHFRYRNFKARYHKRYIVNGSKSLRLRAWRAQLSAARLRGAFVHQVHLLAHARRTGRAVRRRLGLDANRSGPADRGVVVVAERRSGSTWFAQQTFGARPDVFYLYEPCRARSHLRDAVGTWFDEECVVVLQQALDCALPYATYARIRSDADAVQLSSPGIFRSYRHFVRTCVRRMVAVKTVRVLDPRALASAHTLVVHLERDADSVIASRRHMRLDTFGVREGQLHKRRGSNLTIRLEDAREDPVATAERLYGLLSLSRVEQAPRARCRSPKRRSWDACANDSVR